MSECTRMAEGSSQRTRFTLIKLTLDPPFLSLSVNRSVCSVDLVTVERILARAKLEHSPKVVNLNPER